MLVMYEVTFFGDNIELRGRNDVCNRHVFTPVDTEWEWSDDVT